MESRKTEERSSIVVAVGIFLVIVFILVVLGLAGSSQMPADVTAIGHSRIIEVVSILLV